MRNLPKGSESWNFMSKCRHIISKFLSWDVGLGDEALFWEDSWDGFPPIISRPFPLTLKEKLVSSWGVKVKDYKLKISSEGSVKWVWKSLEDAGCDLEEIQAYEEILSDRRVKQSRRKDELIWVASKDGKYNVRSGYKSLIHSQRWDQIEIPLNLCWDAACLPKSGFFLWLASQNRILTEDRLHKFGILGPSRCVLCKHNSEDADHILYSCPFSQSCWEWLRLKLGWSSPLPRTFSELLKGWPVNRIKGIYRKLWNICPTIMSWEIWKERNRRIFQNMEMKPENLLLKIEASIVEVTNSHLRKVQKEEGSFSTWDGLMKKSWSKLINPPLVYAKNSKKASEDCKWSPPSYGWYKLNFDRAA